MKIGVFFGGQSREREISFSGAKTVIQCIDKTLFEPVPIFIDSLGNFILIEEKYLTYPNIRSFYPPQKFIPSDCDGFSVYAESLPENTNFDAMAAAIGVKISLYDFKKYIDFAFLIVHGTYSEDGSIQGLLEWLNIPFSGCGIFPSSLSIDKHLQKNFLAKHCHLRPYGTLKKQDWLHGNQKEIFEDFKQKYGMPLVFKAPYQGSSIGVSILQNDDFKAFRDSVHSSFFLKEITKDEWLAFDTDEKVLFIQKLIDLDKGIGLPVIFYEAEFLGGNIGEVVFRSPKDLIEKLDDYFSYSHKPALITSFDSEELILVESFIQGKEFSCGVLRLPNGEAVALPPTEIISPSQNYDFTAKYAAGGSRKLLPVSVDLEANEKIQSVVKAIFEDFACNVYSRIDGFVTENDEIIIIDTNNIPGMSPTSLIFRQAAEIGFNPTQFINYIILQSLKERSITGKKPYHWHNLHEQLSRKIAQRKNQILPFELILLKDTDSNPNALADVRNAYNAIYASGKAIPLVLLVSLTPQKFYQLTLLPIAFLLRANIDEIKADFACGLNLLIEKTIDNTKTLTDNFVGNFNPYPTLVTFDELQEMGVEISAASLEKIIKN